MSKIFRKVVTVSLFLILAYFGIMTYAALVERDQIRAEREREHAFNSIKHLELGEWSWKMSSESYVKVEGEVTNISGESLKYVEAVVTFTTKDDTFITSESSLIEYDPLLPNQKSPWSVLARYNPAMQSAIVEFKTLRGQRLNVKYPEKKKP